MAVCGVEFVRWFWTGPWLVTCRLDADHEGEHCEVPESSSTSEKENQ